MTSHRDIAAAQGMGASGSSVAATRHWHEAYAALRAMAAFRLASIPKGPTFQPTDVLHEAFVRILESESRATPSDGQDGASTGSAFDEERAVATLAAAIRSVLVDRVRRRAVRTRHRTGVAEHERGRIEAQQPGCELLLLDEALERLCIIDPRAARVVELRYFAGLSVQHTATLMGQALSTTERDWRFAKAWLAEQLGQHGGAMDPEPVMVISKNREGSGAPSA